MPFRVNRSGSSNPSPTDEAADRRPRGAASSVSPDAPGQALQSLAFVPCSDDDDDEEEHPQLATTAAKVSGRAHGLAQEWSGEPVADGDASDVDEAPSARACNAAVTTPKHRHHFPRHRRHVIESQITPDANRPQHPCAPPQATAVMVSLPASAPLSAWLGLAYLTIAFEGK